MNLVSELAHIGLATCRDILPIAAIIFGFQFAITKRLPPNTAKVITGFGWVLAGLTFFLVGLEMCLFPLGRLMAEQLTAPGFVHGVAEAATIAQGVNWQDYYWVYIFAFLIGFSTTIAEPSLIAVALEASKVSGGTISVWGLRVAVAIGVAIGISLGCYRIVVGDPIHYYIITGYVVVIVQTFFAPKTIVPLAYDSGGVTTSTVTVPLVAALGLGLSETVPGRSPLIDGFGLIAFASLFPIITVMAYAQLSEWLAGRKSRSARDGVKPQQNQEVKNAL